MKSSVMRRDGCSLKTEFIRAILAALRLASALVGQNCRRNKQFWIAFSMLTQIAEILSNELTVAVINANIKICHKFKVTT